jgi:uncharacterized protein YcbX
MALYTLSEIYIYPIKSLGGIRLQEAQVQEKGLAYDRRWMLVDEKGNFLTQRQHANMALLEVSLLQEGLQVRHKQNLLESLFIPFSDGYGQEVQVQVWEDVCTGLEVNGRASAWFSEALQMPARLVYMPDQERRLVDREYAHAGETVSFADGYPLLLIGQASLDELNSRLAEPVPMNRFRPNLVFAGGAPFAEDGFDTFAIGDVTFRAAKPCARCVVTTIDQDTGIKSAEPLKTLSTFRLHRNKVMFGQNLLHKETGVLRVGDVLHVLETKAPLL